MGKVVGRRLIFHCSKLRRAKVYHALICRAAIIGRARTILAIMTTVPRPLGRWSSQSSSSRESRHGCVARISVLGRPINRAGASARGPSANRSRYGGRGTAHDVVVASTAGYDGEQEFIRRCPAGGCRPSSRVHVSAEAGFVVAANGIANARTAPAPQSARTIAGHGTSLTSWRQREALRMVPGL